MAGYGFLAERCESGASIPIEYGYLTTSQTIAAGDALGYAADGRLAIVATFTAGQLIAGVAAEAKTTGAGVLTTKIGYYPASETIVFSGQCDGTPTQATVGTAVDIEGTTGAMEINENSSTMACIRIVGLNGRSSAFGAQCSLDFKFVKAKTNA